eukprot:4283865-Amphidinium_carterae.1
MAGPLRASRMRVALPSSQRRTDYGKLKQMHADLLKVNGACSKVKDDLSDNNWDELSSVQRNTWAEFTNT